jgi:hypothetical protein
LLSLRHVLSAVQYVYKQRDTERRIDRDEGGDIEERWMLPINEKDVTIDEIQTRKT